MCSAVGRLERIAEVVFLEMCKQLVKNDFLKDFREKWQVCNWPVVFQYFFLKGASFPGK